MKGIDEERLAVAFLPLALHFGPASQQLCQGAETEAEETMDFLYNNPEQGNF